MTKPKTPAPEKTAASGKSAVKTAKPEQETASAHVAGGAYAVLARKYRPWTFDELIGQDAMVRTLRNAFASGRIAQAYMLTGVRGVGKTTTARILARALNYETADVSAPTFDMAGPGEHCAAIMESRHPDVMEIDAASHTGVENIREIIDAVRYRPAYARTKVYIVDEVHMLSRAAFNALLKTLEEPPEHVKFIFATTEVRKVPPTVLSRCQRFDLRRVDVAQLKTHFGEIAGKEGAELDDEALGLIARAAEGSVRDGLSILDQAIAHASGPVTGADVRAMLGLADRARILALLETVLKGDAGAALEDVRALYDDGAEPAQILGDLAESVHGVTRIAAAGEKAGDPTLSETEHAKAASLAGGLGMPALARAWQVLLKGLAEVDSAPRPLAAVEMVLVRLAYMADLPAPQDLVRAAAKAPGGPAPQADTPASPAGVPETMQAAPRGSGPGPAQAQAAPSGEPLPETAPEPEMATGQADPALVLETFEDVVALVEARRERKLGHALEHRVRLVRFAPPRIELQTLEGAPSTLANELRENLTAWTGQQWWVVVSDEEGEVTLAEQRRAREAEAEEARRRDIEALKEHPAVRAVLERFPDAEITDVRDMKPPHEDDS